MNKFSFSALVFVVALAACSSGPVSRYATPLTDIEARISIPYSAVEVREVSLPGYAAADEIVIEAVDGALRTESTNLWADTPTRAVTLQLAQALSMITKARVASEPWPFESSPQARVDVRIAELLARDDGSYTATGQYFVANGFDRTDRARGFELKVLFDVNGGSAALAKARTELIIQLAQDIARKGLR